MRNKAGLRREGLPRSVILAIYVTFSSLFLSLLFSWAQGLSGYLLVALCLVVTLIVYLMTLFMASKYLVGPLHSALRRFEDKSNLVLRKVDGGQSEWLIDNESLMGIENGQSVKAAWVVSYDLPGDLNGGAFIPTVKQNLERGVEYVYFLPNILQARAMRTALKTLHGDHNNVKVRSLGDDFFFLVQGLDFIIYNPRNDGGDGGRSGYMGLPISGEYGRWNVKMSDNLVEALVGYLEPLLENEVLR